MEPRVQGIYANGLRILGRADEARTEAIAAIAADSEADTAWLALGVMADDEGDAAAAMNFYRRVVEIEPESYLGNSGLAEAAFSLGDYAQAEKSYTALLALEPTVITYLSRAAARSYLDDVNGAWKDLDAALALAPADPEVRASRGDLHMYAEDHEAARAEYDAGLAIAPDHAHLRLSRAIVFRDAGQFDAALRDLNAGLSAHPDDPILIAQKGVVYYVMDDPLSPVEWLDKAIAMNPQDAYSLWARSRAKRSSICARARAARRWRWPPRCGTRARWSPAIPTSGGWAICDRVPSGRGRISSARSCSTPDARWTRWTRGAARPMRCWSMRPAAAPAHGGAIPNRAGGSARSRSSACRPCSSACWKLRANCCAPAGGSSMWSVRCWMPKARKFLAGFQRPIRNSGPIRRSCRRAAQGARASG